MSKLAIDTSIRIASDFFSRNIYTGIIITHKSWIFLYMQDKNLEDMNQKTVSNLVTDISTRVASGFSFRNMYIL